MSASSKKKGRIEKEKKRSEQSEKISWKWKNTREGYRSEMNSKSGGNRRKRRQVDFPREAQWMELENMNGFDHHFGPEAVNEASNARLLYNYL